MALDAGNAACTTGLSKRIFDAWTGDTANNGFSNPLAAAQATAVKSMCHAIAVAVVAEITTNARVDPGGADWPVV